MVIMRYITQKASNIDKQINCVLPRAVWLSCLLSVSCTSLRSLLLFAFATILGVKSAQATLPDLPASLPDQTVPSEPTRDNHITAVWSELVPHEEKKADQEAQQNFSFSATNYDQNHSRIREYPRPITEVFTSQHETRKSDQELAPTGSEKYFSQRQNNSVVLPLSFPAHQTVAAGQEGIPNSTSTHQEQEQHNLYLPTVSEHDLPVQLVTADQSQTTANTTAEGEEIGADPSRIESDFYLIEERDSHLVKYQVSDQSAPVPAAITPKPPGEHQLPINLAVTSASTAIPLALVPQPPVTVIEQNSVKTIILVQAAGENEPDRSLIPQNLPPKNSALTPTLDLQGVYLNQGDDAARLRLRGIYPVSPNALFGAIVDLATGEDFAGTEGSGLNLTELYFTGSLPNYANLRLTVGLMDLTSYFDRNSFAKDSTTHFFHPLFQTNPALASSGIGSRIGALLNWNITDNFEAKAAVFSSERNLGDLSLNAFAGEVGFRAGNGIIRATYASNQDTGRDGVFGTRNGDRENAFGINGEVYIPQIKMGLFARYGWLDNRDRDDNTETYNFGLNFLDLFRKNDRLGLGYAFGQNFSEDNDVWELFYDIRVARNLRAGVTLQEREGFSETIFGFRVKTDLSLYP